MPKSPIDGADPDDRTGPEFPIDFTTITPIPAARSSAGRNGSNSRRTCSGIPRLMLITSIPSATASSTAFRIAAELELSPSGPEKIL